MTIDESVFTVYSD